MEPAGFGLREPERRSPSEVSSGDRKDVVKAVVEGDR
jgi:hypothetical protein